MAFLEILKYPDPGLRVKAEPVDRIDADLRTLIGDMRDTMYVDKGVGLAAVQVGVAKRLIVLDVPDEDEEEEHGETPADPSMRRERGRGENFMALVNPEIVESSGEMKYEEGCLSVPDVTAEVKRASSVTVKAVDVTSMADGGEGDGEEVLIEAEGLLAVVFQHEIDHLDGILFIDRLSRLRRDIIKRRLRKAHAAAQGA